jgi:hypothetical protein
VLDHVHGRARDERLVAKTSFRCFELCLDSAKVPIQPGLFAGMVRLRLLKAHLRNGRYDGQRPYLCIQIVPIADYLRPDAREATKSPLESRENVRGGSIRQPDEGIEPISGSDA